MNPNSTPCSGPISEPKPSVINDAFNALNKALIELEGEPDRMISSVRAVLGTLEEQPPEVDATSDVLKLVNTITNRVNRIGKEFAKIRDRVEL